MMNPISDVTKTEDIQRDIKVFRHENPCFDMNNDFETLLMLAASERDSSSKHSLSGSIDISW